MGGLSDPFTPARGLRQGDPISPYLFLLCVEGLSSLMKKEEQVYRLKGVRNGITDPGISHLLFADDTIFFTRADLKSINSLKSVLKTYGEGYGQKINLQKSTIFFGSRCPLHVKQQIMEVLKVQNESNHTNYLGIPMYVGQSKNNTFNLISDNMRKRVQS
jgi:hypothetical protein